VEKQSITSQIRQFGCSNMGFPSGLQFVLHQESSVSKSFMAMNQTNTLVPIKDLLDLRCKDFSGVRKAIQIKPFIGENSV